MMKSSKTLFILSIVAALLAACAAGAGLFWQHPGQPFSITTLRGQTVELYGQGLYRYDTTLTAAGYRTGDAFTLLAGIPFVLVATWLYRRGSVRGGLMLAGALAYLLYNSSSQALGAAYNNLLPVYITLTTVTLLGFLIFMRSIDACTLRAHYGEAAPRRGVAHFLIVCGVILYCIWLLMSIIPAMLAGSVPPEVGPYTTVITFVLDMGIIAPTLVVSGILLRRDDPLGYVLAPILLIFTDVLGLCLTVMGTGQMMAGLMNMGQFIGMVVSFAILTLVSLRFTVTLFRNISEIKNPVLTSNPS